MFGYVISFHKTVPSRAILVNCFFLKGLEGFLEGSFLIKEALFATGGLMGNDKNGNIISMQPMGRVRPKSLIPTGRVSDLYRLSILECEASMALLRQVYHYFA